MSSSKVQKKHLINYNKSSDSSARSDSSDFSDSSDNSDICDRYYDFFCQLKQKKLRERKKRWRNFVIRKNCDEKKEIVTKLKNSNCEQIQIQM